MTTRKAAATRARLLEAASEVFGETGFIESRVADIVTRAGVSHGTFYHYFASREDVLRHIAADVDVRLSAPLDEVLVQAVPQAPAVQIRAAVFGFLAAYQALAPIVRVVEEASRYDDSLRTARQARSAHYTGALAETIRALQRRRLVDRRVDPAVAAAALAAMTAAFPETWLTQGMIDCSLEAAADQLATIFINALGLSEGTPDEHPVDV